MIISQQDQLSFTVRCVLVVNFNLKNVKGKDVEEDNAVEAAEEEELS